MDNNNKSSKELHLFSLLEIEKTNKKRVLLKSSSLIDSYIYTPSSSFISNNNNNINNNKFEFEFFFSTSIMNFKQEDLMENKEEVHVFDSDADEALSLCDLPLHEGGEGNNSKRLSSDYHPQDFFEFFNDLNSEMNSIVVAEDIIFCGKLLPYRSSPDSPPPPPPPPPFRTQTKRNSKKNEARFIDENFPHRRSFSLNEPRNSTIKGRVMSNSYSLDYRKMQKISSSKMTRTASTKSEKDQQQNPVRNVKPKWHLFMFGIMKTPTEMELSDIRNRQSKRIPTPLFPVINGEETVTVKRDGSKRASWSVLRALGCKGANAVVTASLGCLPHV